MVRTKSKAAIFSIGFFLLVFSPVKENWKENPSDNFPLSYYPMFTKKRGATYKMYYLVGYDAQGGRHLIPYRLAGTGGFNQVRRQITKMSSSGKGDELIAKVAKRIAQQEDSTFKNLVRLELVRGTIQIDRYFSEEDYLPEQEEQIACQNLSL